MSMLHSLPLAIQEALQAAIKAAIPAIAITVGLNVLPAAMPVAYANSEATSPTAVESVPIESRQYTFSWQFLDGDVMQPRGGTSMGTPVDLARAPSQEWRGLQAENLTKYERDRAAILAMAGPYRTSFDFIETAGFVADYAPSAPYQSWGTEFVYVVADAGDFISLQHILVMRVVLPDGESSEPIVVKHWRQDWHFERRVQHNFIGHNTWQARTLSKAEAAGTWTQRVFQVDDSPRYQAHGEWRHTANHSSWESVQTWRPLPRREFSVRDDYQVLVGRNRHTITPSGWVQEEDNLKVRLDSATQSPTPSGVLAKEVGLARYERIENFDWSPGDEYWARTGSFWGDVRAAWESRFATQTTITLKSRVDNQPLFATLFALADEVSESPPDKEQGPSSTATTVRTKIDTILDAYLE